MRDRSKGAVIKTFKAFFVTIGLRNGTLTLGDIISYETLSFKNCTVELIVSPVKSACPSVLIKTDFISKLLHGIAGSTSLLAQLKRIKENIE
jgi:hypothetical protein